MHKERTLIKIWVAFIIGDIGIEHRVNRKGPPSKSSSRTSICIGRREWSLANTNRTPRTTAVVIHERERKCKRKLGCCDMSSYRATPCCLREITSHVYMTDALPVHFILSSNDMVMDDPKIRKVALKKLTMFHLPVPRSRGK